MMPWASMTGHSVATVLCRDDHCRCLAGRYGGAWGKGGDGWMDGGRHFGPKLLDESPRGPADQFWTSRLGGELINCYLGLCLPTVACPWGDMVIDHWSQSFKLIWSNLEDW